VNDFAADLKERLPLIFAVALSTLWALVVGAYVSAHGGFGGLLQLPPFELAVVTAAAFGPLAALWLVVMVVAQQRALSVFARRLGELALQNRQSLQQAESQARTLTQLQAQGAKMQALDTRRLALGDMASSAAVLAERLGVMNRDTVNTSWARYGAGDVNVFVQAFLAFSASHPDIAVRMGEAVARDQVAAAALATFVRRYDQIAAAIGEDKLAGDILADGALGRGFRLFKQADEQAAKAMQARASGDVDQETLRKLTALAERLEASAPAPRPVA
jgi:hypothetical protein